jgi:hypothetical protein
MMKCEGAIIEMEPLSSVQLSQLARADLHFVSSTYGVALRKIILSCMAENLDMFSDMTSWDIV